MIKIQKGLLFLYKNINTFLNNNSLVGIVYMATTAAFLTTHGWCLANVLL